ncbi:ribonuclease H-like domain-containing protein [Tanacetum coccineum]|uniref:Ribonuclease H-like domain-containing protein n=1 Tax=Tanacetum coccineum TaxID=301880 RepID=A0ABQ5G9D2_9ASTR
MASIFGSKSKSFMTMSIPPQDEPLTNQLVNARLSKFEADFNQKQGEITNKIDTVLKAITDRITGALPSDMVKNPKLNVNITSPVLSAHSYPTKDPQCSTRQKEKGTLENINTTPPSPPDPSISFITEKVHKLNSFLKSSDLVPRSSDTKFVCTKDDGDIMFIQIIGKYDDCHEEGLEDEENATIEGLEVEYFDTFPTRSELAYHKYLMSGPIPSLFLRNPIITEGCPSNLKIPCNIGHVHVEKAYIDLNSPLNVMTRMLYNWIRRRKLDPMEDPNKGVSNFMGRIKRMHVFVGNFSYIIDFMIVEDISSIIYPRLSQVVLGKPFIEISNMTHDLSLGMYTPKSPSSWHQSLAPYDHVNPATRRTIDQSANGKLHDRNLKESRALLEDLALYDKESWNDPRDFAKPVKLAICVNCIDIDLQVDFWIVNLDSDTIAHGIRASPDLYASAIYAKNAFELWIDLKDTYNKQFDAMISLPACICDAAEHFEKHNQLIKLIQFLMGLDDNYLDIRSNILTREPLPLVKPAFDIVSSEESHRNITSANSTKPTATIFAAKAFDKKRFNTNSGSNSNNNKGSNSGSNSNNRGTNPNLKCTNCNKIGHTIDRCFEIIGYRVGYVMRNFNSNSKSVGTSNNTAVDPNSNIAGNNTATNSPVSFSNEQLTRLMNLLNDNRISSANAKMSNFFNGNTDFIVGNISLGWIVDSVANQHMTISAKFLVNIVDISNLGLTVGHPNGTQALIIKIRDLKLNDNITLYDVLVVPEYTVSLLSGHKLSRDNKLFVGFDDNHCYIQDLKANKNTLWHQRLGHPTDQVLDVLKTTLNLDSQSASNHLCECNDFSRAIWVYMLKGKDDVYDSIVYKIKYRSSGDIDRYKARFVVKGCNQKEGIDFDETFSPVVKMSTVKCVIALSVINNWLLFQLDVNNAFLYGELEEDIYMTILKGFSNKENENKVCKLVKSLYGLKQAPRKWNEKLFSILKENNFVQSANDHSLFTKSKNNKFIALLVYVDDIVVTGNCVDEINKFKVFLKSKKYCLELLKEYGLLRCKPVSTPIVPNSVLPYEPTSNDPLLENITGYQKLLGKLIYLTHTRPNIAYSVHCLAQYMHSPLKSHLNSALNVLRYLKGVVGKGIRYRYPIDKGSLCGYSDADWAKCLKTKKSVTEAEYRSLASAACEIIWIQKLLMDLKTKVTLPDDLFCDNKSALQLAINPVFHERSKYFEIDVHFIREKIAKGLLSTKKICSSNQVADIFTKHLPVYQHKILCEKLGMFDLFSKQIKGECSNKFKNRGTEPVHSKVGVKVLFQN